MFAVLVGVEHWAAGKLLLSASTQGVEGKRYLDVGLAVLDELMRALPSALLDPRLQEVSLYEGAGFKGSGYASLLVLVR